MLDVWQVSEKASAKVKYDKRFKFPVKIQEIKVCHLLEKPEFQQNFFQRIATSRVIYRFPLLVLK